MLIFMAFALVPLGYINAIIWALYGCQKPLDGAGAHSCIGCYGTVCLTALTAAQELLRRMSGILCWSPRTIVLFYELEAGGEQEECKLLLVARRDLNGFHLVAALGQQLEGKKLYPSYAFEYEEQAACLYIPSWNG